MPQQTSSKSYSPEEFQDTGQKSYSPDEFLESPTKIAEKTFPGAVKTAAQVGPILPGGRTMLSTLAGMGTTALTESPVLGSAASAATDTLLDPKTYTQSFGRNALDFGKSVLLNELFGRGLSGAAKVGQEIVSPGSVLPEEMQKLLPYKPTVSQFTGSNLSNLIENTFASRQKQAAILRSAGVINNEAEQALQSLTGRSDIGLNQPFGMAATIQKDIEQQFDASKLESNKRGLAASVIARANPELIPTFTKDPLTGAISPSTPYVVRGKIVPTNYLREAQLLKDSLNKSDVPPDPNSPIARALDSILNRNQMLDAQGNTVPKPRDFGDMWETKKAIDDIAYNNPKSQTDFTDTRFQKLANAINQDITDSAPSWSNNGQAASRLFQEAKTIVGQRNKVFLKAPIEKLVNEETGDIPAINQVIDNPKLLSKSLIAGNLAIPEGGNAAQTNIKYITNNTRKDLQGYEFQRIINSAKYVDDKNQVLFDAQKALDAFSDPNKQESYKMLYSAQNRADIEQFFKNMSAVSQKGQTGVSRYWVMRLTGTGLGLGAGLISGMGTLPSSAVGIVGGTVGLNALGRLLTNPSTARLMVAAAQGGPLNMPTMIASRAIANVLKNTPMTINYADGNKIQGRINSEGKFVLPIGKGELSQ